MTAHAQHKQNGDTASHATKATEAVARKYYVQVEGKTLEDARLIIKRLVEKGLLKDSAYYNQAIIRDTQEKERVKVREEKRKAQEEADKKAREEHEERKQHEESGDYTLNDDVRLIIENLIKHGAREGTIKGALKAITALSKAQIEQCLTDLFPEKNRTARGDSLDGKFNRFCSEQIRTVEEMTAYINAIGTPNFIRFMPHLITRGEFFNAIHAKYAK